MLIALIEINIFEPLDEQRPSEAKSSLPIPIT